MDAEWASARAGCCAKDTVAWAVMLLSFWLSCIGYHNPIVVHVGHCDNGSDKD